ncbi:MAG TPA: sugar ABC transporter substrate-binding protein [Ktedonobacterales bacterium]
MRLSRVGTARRASVALASLALVSLLAACGSGGSSSNGGGGGAGVTGPKNALVNCPASGGSTASPESGNVSLTVSGWTSSPAEDALVQQGLNDFMKANPNIKVTWSPIPSDYQTKMRANVASGNVPDVFYLSPDMSQEYIPAGKLLDLSPYMARDNVAASAYYPALMQPFDCSSGAVYGIPKDWNSLGLFYNKTMFQQAGLSDPSTWTWQDLQNAAQKLTTGSAHGLALPADASRFGAFLFANGGQMLSSNGQSAAFNSTAGQAAATFYTSFELNHTGVMPSDVGAGWDGEAFGKGLVGMTFEGGWMIPYMSQSFPNVSYGIAPLPKSPTGANDNLVYTNAWGASSATKHPDAAWKLIQFMTAANYQTQVLHDGFALPTLQSLASDPYFQSNPGVKVLEDGAQNGHADFYGPADSQVHQQLSAALQAIMLKKGTVNGELATASQTVDTWIQQNVHP